MKKVGNIQNAALGEHRIRDLNDEINDLIKEKKEYEARIRQLGGPDYREEQDHFELDGQEVPGSDVFPITPMTPNRRIRRPMPTWLNGRWVPWAARSCWNLAG